MTTAIDPKYADLVTAAVALAADDGCRCKHCTAFLDAWRQRLRAALEALGVEVEL